MGIRSYRNGDRGACIDILQSNTPEYFGTRDSDEFASFLDDQPGPYFVDEHGGEVQACGGWAVDRDGAAVLTWGMVRRDVHRKGIGSALLRHRLDRIRDDGRCSIVRIRTVQLVQGFFSRFGFRVVSVEHNGFGAGLDRVTMQLFAGEGRTAVDR